jgi:hypothetical protein
MRCIGCNRLWQRGLRVVFRAFVMSRRWPPSMTRDFSWYELCSIKRENPKVRKPEKDRGNFMQDTSWLGWGERVDFCSFAA